MSEKLEVQKDKSMELQKEMIAAHYKRLSRAKESGKKVVYTFVPGNLNELIWSFDMLPPWASTMCFAIVSPSPLPLP